jgi:hypothetical protein
MNKQTAALIALYAGWMLTADTAHAITYEDIAGQWCGDVTDYVFAPNTLTVKFHDGNAQRCPLSEVKRTLVELCEMSASRSALTQCSPCWRFSFTRA